MHETLTGKNIGLVFLGNTSDQLDSLVRDARDARPAATSRRWWRCASRLTRPGSPTQATGYRYTALASDPSLTKEFGIRIGRQLVSGGQLLERVHTSLLSSYDGELGKLEGLVVVRSDPANMSEQDAKSADEFNSGLIAGVAAEGVPAVGVELRSTEPSQIPWYKAEKLASVDDLDTIAGRTALAFALAGDHGAYGVKSTADALLPPVVR